MMKKNKKFKGLRNFVWRILRTLKLAACVQLILESKLVDDGWFRSYYQKESVDRENNPIPWNTYAFIKFIEPRLKKEFRVFEYGCGNSTIWYSKRTRLVVAVENNREWYEKIKVLLPENAQLVYKELEYNGEYSREVLNHAEQFNIIIVDGRDRVNSVKNSVKKLSEDGIIIFDNAELSQYKDAIQFLNQHSFKQIEFWGMSPITAHNTSTSIFYRTNNCLAI